MLFVRVFVWKSVKYLNLLYMFSLILEAVTNLVLHSKKKKNTFAAEFVRKLVG